MIAWMVISTILMVLFFASTCILSWYIFQLLKKIWLFSDGIKHFLRYMNNYASHVKSIYEMDLFYGDETLQALLRHSREAVKYVKEFGTGFMWEEEDKIFKLQEYNDEDEDEENKKIDVGGTFEFDEEE